MPGSDRGSGSPRTNRPSRRVIGHRNLRTVSILPKSGGVMPVLANDFLGSHGSESRALSPPHVQDTGAPMTETSLTTQVPPEAAPALQEGLPASSDGHLCPVCGEPLRPRH